VRGSFCVFSLIEEAGYDSSSCPPCYTRIRSPGSPPPPYNPDSSDDYQNGHDSSPLVFFLSIFYQKHRTRSNEKMIRSLLIATLCLSSTVVVSVSATNVPFTHSLAKRTSKAQILGVPLEKRQDVDIVLPCYLTCDSGNCWYVASPLLFSSFIMIHFCQPMLTSNN